MSIPSGWISKILPAGGLLLASALANAGGPVFYEYAPVVDVEPVVHHERVPVDREVCWLERGYEVERRGPDSATGTIAGAIIGGVIGNQFGGGNGRRALTVAGAALGASVGNDVSRNQRAEYRRPISYERCEIQRDYETRSYTSGYRVKYEYNGEIFETRTRTAPGDVIRLEVAARPID